MQSIKSNFTIDSQNRITTTQQEGKPTNIAITLSDIKVYDGDLKTLSDILQKHFDENPRFTLTDCYNEELQCYLFYMVSVASLSSLINETDWRPRYYKLHTHAVNDFNKSCNIGYKVNLSEIRMKPDPDKESQLQNADNFEHFVSTLMKHDTQSYTISCLEYKENTGRPLTNTSIIVVIDQDNEIVDIRPPFAHEIHQYHLINQFDDCNERFLLDSTTDNTETEIIKEIFDNFVYPNIDDDNQYDQGLSYTFINLMPMLIRNFFSGSISCKKLKTE